MKTLTGRHAAGGFGSQAGAMRVVRRGGATKPGEKVQIDVPDGATRRRGELGPDGSGEGRDGTNADLTG